MSGWTPVAGGVIHYDGVRYRAEVTRRGWRLLDTITGEERSRRHDGEYPAAIYIPAVVSEIRRMSAGMPPSAGVEVADD